MRVLPRHLAERYRRAVDVMTVPGPVREHRLSQFLHEYRDRRARSTGRLRVLFTRPAASLTAAHDLLRLPLLTVDLSDSADGAAMRRAVLPPWSPLRLLPHAAVLVLPERGADYLQGSSKQTLRRQVRKARSRGVTWRTVTDPQERRRLIELADDWERSNPSARYRNANPANDDLAQFGLWLLACSADGRPLVLSVTPVDGDWAMLHYFRSIGMGDEQSLARYLLMTVLVEHLVAAGVRHLVNAGTPIRLSNGLRHYQRMVGFRTFRLTVRRRPARREEPAPEPSRVTRVLRLSA